MSQMRKGAFLSGDGTRRCRGCHLTSVDCNCSPKLLRKLLRLMGLLKAE